MPSIQLNLDAECEMLWTQIQRSRDLLVGCFYMPHRNHNDMNELERSLIKITGDERQKHVLLAGRFQLPDVNWNTGAVKAGAPERSVQQALVDITSAAHLTHEEPTREQNISDLVSTSNNNSSMFLHRHI